LAAAGAIEAVFCVLAIRNQSLFSTNTFFIEMEETSLLPILNYSDNQKIKNVLSNSFGFGGNCTSLIFSSN
jgi:3-oxoacyl-[acyl-carrier-protein] synthase-1